MEIPQYLPVGHEGCTPLLDGFFFFVLKILLIVSGIELNPGPKDGLTQEYEIQSLNSHVILREQISHACLTDKWDEVKKILERFFTTDSVEYKQIVKINNVNYLPTEAVQNGYMMLIQILLIHGLPVNRKYNDGNSLLHVASIHGEAGIAKLLVTHGADVNMKNNDTDTPLHCAAIEGYLNTVKVLLEHGAYINAKTIQGDTALHLAAYYNKVSVFKCLLNNGCNRSLTNNDDDTALEIALEKNNYQIVSLLSSN